jgi:hypothetical protein
MKSIIELIDALDTIDAEGSTDSLLALHVIRQAGPELRRLHAENHQWRSVFGHLGTPDEIGNEWIALQDGLNAVKPQEPVCEVANVLGNMVTALCEGVPPAPGDKLYAAPQPKAEPVANIGCLGMPVNTPVTAPQPRKRLTIEEIDAIRLSVGYAAGLERFVSIVRAIEAAVWGEKT